MSVSKGVHKKHLSTKHQISEYEEESSCLLDDTPRAFTRLIHLTRASNGVISSPRNASSDGTKTKSSNQNSSNAKESQLRIRGGEKLSDFGARVDQALPIADLVKKSNKRSKDYNKSQEKNIENKKRPTYRLRGSNTLPENEDVKNSSLALDTEAKASDGNTVNITSHSEKKRKSRRAQSSNLEDPWAVLETKRHKPSGLHDVAQAPPALKSLQRTNTLTGSEWANSRTKISPRRKEDLELVRKSLIQNYRTIMAERRGTTSQI